MKVIIAAALLALTVTTGFTCSKNQPAEQAAPAQEQMAAPADAAAAPTEAAPADPAAPAPAEQAPATH